MKNQVKELEKEVRVLESVLRIPQDFGILVTSHDTNVIKKMISNKQNQLKMLVMQD